MLIKIKEELHNTKDCNSYKRGSGFIVSVLRVIHVYEHSTVEVYQMSRGI